MAERDMRRETEMQAQQQWAAQPPAPPAATDRVAQLTALADLKAQGLLTDAEFATEKARVLGS